MPRSGSRVRVPSRALAMKIAYAAVAQSVERRIGSAEVTGPIPVSSSSKISRKPLDLRALKKSDSLKKELGFFYVGIIIKI